jgi:hypothetical protein
MRSLLLSVVETSETNIADCLTAQEPYINLLVPQSRAHKHLQHAFIRARLEEILLSTPSPCEYLPGSPPHSKKSPTCLFPSIAKLELYTSRAQGAS